MSQCTQSTLSVPCSTVQPAASGTIHMPHVQVTMCKHAILCPPPARSDTAEDKSTAEAQLKRPNPHSTVQKTAPARHRPSASSPLSPAIRPPVEAVLLPSTAPHPLSPLHSALTCCSVAELQSPGALALLVERREAMQVVADDGLAPHDGPVGQQLSDGAGLLL